MGKNIYEYPLKTLPVEEDKVLGTDTETGGTSPNQETKNFLLTDIAALGPWRINSNNNSLSYTGSENVGIGTDDPAERFAVKDGFLQVGNNNSVLLKYNEGADYSRIIFNNTDSTDEQYLIAYGSNHTNAHQLALKSINAAGTLTFYTSNVSSGVERMRISATGNIGINTKIPISTLHVDGTLTIDTDTSSENAISMRNASSNANYIFKINNNDGFFRLHDQNVNQTRVVVSNTGKVGISENTPLEMLHVNGNIRADSYITNSDIVLKDNIQPIESMLEKVKQLGNLARKYTLKKNRKIDIGFIAQDIEKIFPDVVSSQSIKGINYQKLTVYLAKAFSELCERLNI